MAQKFLDTVDLFDPHVDDRTIYVEQLEQYFNANKMEDNQKVAVFFYSYREESKQNTLQPANPSSKTLDDLLVAMTSRVNPKSLVIVERFKFHRQNQQKSESVSQY